jgi:hypothetical protein
MLKNCIVIRIPTWVALVRGYEKIKMFYEKDAEKLLIFKNSGIYHWQEETIILGHWRKIK